MKLLLDELIRYGESDVYPYHMPGHKRNKSGSLPEDFYLRDITEIEGFDNLHQAEGILLKMQREAAKACGADESFYLVNGSTSGILSAMSAAVSAGGHILMSRNCHKSAYHAVYLRNLKVSYLVPGILEPYGILDTITPKQVKEALEQAKDVEAVLIVSPTYEGRIADIRKIADIVHAKGIPLIVDEAHGAHLGFSGAVAENSCRQGADLVIQSVHKTLPSLTQTAILHVTGERVNREKLKRFLRIYQTSSPSYLLMGSIQNAYCYVEDNKEQLYDAFQRNWRSLLGRLHQCRKLTFVEEDSQKQDIGKLVISVRNTNRNGHELYEILLQKYHLQMEMAAENYVLAMFTINDTKEGYDRLAEALLEIDQSLERKEDDTSYAYDWNGNETEERLLLATAWEEEQENCLLTEAMGRYAGEFIHLYPPGIPLVVPGEQITKELVEKIIIWEKQGLNVQGIETMEDACYVRVLKRKNVS